MARPQLTELKALEVWPFNATDYEHGHEASFAERPVLGTRPPLDWVGEGPETWVIKARRASGRPQYLMRGDGAQMGWVVIERVSERSSYLDAEGIGRVIDVNIAVRRAAKPSNGCFYSLFSGLFS